MIAHPSMHLSGAYEQVISPAAKKAGVNPRMGEY
jgi:hypothetical protein